MADEIQLSNGLHHVAVNVSDMEKSIKFYRDVLGLRLMFGPQPVSGPGFERTSRVPRANIDFTMLEAGNGSTRVELIKFHNPKGKPNDRKMFDGGAAHIAFRVKDIGKMVTKLKKNGVEFFSQPLKIDGGPLKGGAFVYFSDPDGVVLELFQD